MRPYCQGDFLTFSRGRAQDVRRTCRNVNCLVLERR